MKDTRVWIETDNKFFLREIRREHKKLEPHVYILEADDHGNMWLRKIDEEFQFDYKMYGLETTFIDRCVKTYQNTDRNLGLLLNGIKGTGKTVTAKNICNRLKMPTILIDSALPNGHLYLNDIPQDITILIDEYEKIFREDADMLTIMDGAFNSIHRRVFVLTTNYLSINENLIQRPGRIRYLKTFGDLTPTVIREILDDILIHKELYDKVLHFISTLEIITIDIVKAICQEVNIHNEDPENFASIFNIKRISGKYDVYHVNEDGSENLLAKSIKISPRMEFTSDGTVGCSFYLDGDYIGEITKVLDTDTVKVNLRTDYESNYNEFLMKTKSKQSRGGEMVSGDTKKTRKKKNDPVFEEKVFRMQNSFMLHRGFQWKGI